MWIQWEAVSHRGVPLKGVSFSCSFICLSPGLYFLLSLLDIIKWMVFLCHVVWYCYFFLVKGNEASQPWADIFKAWANEPFLFEVCFLRYFFPQEWKVTNTNSLLIAYLNKLLNTVIDWICSLIINMLTSQLPMWL